MTAGGRKVRAFLLEDHKLVREGLSMLIASTPDLVLVGEATTVQEALAAIPQSQPDLVIADFRLPDGDGLAVCRAIRSSGLQTAVLILTAFGDGQILQQAREAGADSCAVKGASASELLVAIRRVVEATKPGGPLGSGQMSHGSMTDLPAAPPAGVDTSE